MGQAQRRARHGRTASGGDPHRAQNKAHSQRQAQADSGTAPATTTAVKITRPPQQQNGPQIGATAAPAPTTPER